MKRLIRKNRSYLREQLRLIKSSEAEEACTEEPPKTVIDESAKEQIREYRKSIREARKENNRIKRQAAFELDSMIEKENDEETIIEKEYFFSEGDMVEIKSRPQIKMADEAEDDRRIGLVLSTKDYVHEYYSSGKPKRISKCILVDVLVGTNIEEWPAKKIKICE
jgi:hypothetical protein